MNPSSVDPLAGNNGNENEEIDFILILAAALIVYSMSMTTIKHYVKLRVICMIINSRTSYMNLSWMAKMYSINHDNSNPNTNEYLNHRIDIMNRVNDKVTLVTGFCKRDRKANVFYEPQSNDIEALQPMFIVCWLASIATLSVALEDPDSDQLNNQFYKPLYYEYSSLSKLMRVCVNGYRYATKIASNLDMDVETDSHVSSLSSFAIFATNKVMKNINIETIKTSIKMAKEEGNVLHRSWFQILNCVLELNMFIKSQTTVNHVLFFNDIDATIATSKALSTHLFDYDNSVLDYINESAHTVYNQSIVNAFKSKQYECFK